MKTNPYSEEIATFQLSLMDSDLKRRATSVSDPPEDPSTSSSVARLPCSYGDVELPRAKIMSSKDLIAVLLSLLSDIEKGGQDANGKLQRFFELCDQLKVTVLLINNFVGAKVYCLKVALFCLFCVKWT